MSIDENTIEFWKQKYEELSIQFDEYQKSSRDFEIELENELKQREDENTSLKSRNSRLQTDNENLKTKISEINVATHKQISTLQEELSKTKSIREEMQKYIRELEQKNDDLERTNRCAMFSLGEFESKLNEALERNAILESELDEKDELAETVQRLRDEARDLKQEMTVRQLKSQKREDLKAQHSMCMETLEQGNQSDQIEKIASIAAAAVAANSQPQQNEANQMISDDISDINMQQQQQQQQKSVSNGHHMHSHPLTPSVRANALNLVGDALRKVTSMEGRLIAARNQMKESNRDRRSTTTTISIDSTR